MVLCVGAFFARWNDAKVLLHWFHNATFAQLPQNWCFWFNIFFCHAPVFQLIAVSFYDWAAHKLRFLKNIPFYFYSISFLTGHFHCTTFSNWIKFKYSEPKVEFKYKLTSWLLVRGYWFMMAEHNSIIYNLICSWKKKRKEKSSSTRSRTMTAINVVGLYESREQLRLLIQILRQTES